MCVIIKNSGKEQTFHSESVAREHANNTGHRFFDLLEVDITVKVLRAATVSGVRTYGPNLAQLRRECERLLRKQTEKEDSVFMRVMKYGEDKQQFDRSVAWNKKVWGGIELCVRPPSVPDARDTSPPVDDDTVSETTVTLDDVTSPDIVVGESTSIPIPTNEQHQ